MEFDAAKCAVFAQILPVFMVISILDARFLRSQSRVDSRLFAYLLLAFVLIITAGETLALYGAAMNGLGETASRIVLDATFPSFFLAVGPVIWEVIRIVTARCQNENGDAPEAGDSPA
ncbi:hypothetical protein [Gordonia sp. 4N]|uniref:hypothetical protein n=1 Tax=Gordonia sp. 4N TaxID=2993508 RepID=UPI002248D1F5|nr:hypothetical protein [Gordonia sp. 4N]MCX2753061.1 hypothetical protein [Gordonia sp. 4N]